MDKPTISDALDRPLRDLRISVIDRCNLRCTYCMPAEVFGPDFAFLPRDQWLDFEQIERLARAFIALGVRKLRLTGGEPLLRPDLPELASRLARIPLVEDIAITTNGLRLGAMAEDLKNAGVRRATISLDALDPEICGRMNGRDLPPDRVLKGVDVAIAAGLSPKINMVVQRGVNDCQILPMARYFHDRNVPVRFIEYMDVGDGGRWNRASVVPSSQVLAILRKEFDLKPIAPAFQGEVAKRYTTPTGDWEAGFISSITAPFCSGCNRARISADGKLYTCLFATEGANLKPLLASAEDESSLTASIGRLWSIRDDRYSELRNPTVSTAISSVPMSYIGG